MGDIGTRKVDHIALCATEDVGFKGTSTLLECVKLVHDALPDLDAAKIDPSVRIYENDPLLGPRFDTALSGTFTMDDTEASFLAVPYFFSKAPGIAWSISGTPSGQGPVVTVKSSGSGRGSASIAAAATGASALETAAANLIISFTGTQPSGGFGSLFGL